MHKVIRFACHKWHCETKDEKMSAFIGDIHGLHICFMDWSATNICW